MTIILPQLPCKRKTTLRMREITLVSSLPQPLLYALQSSLHQTKIWQFPQAKVVSHASFLITCIPEKINTTINYKIDISSSTKKPEHNLGNRCFRTQRAPNIKCSSFDLHCWKVNKIVNGLGNVKFKTHEVQSNTLNIRTINYINLHFPRTATDDCLLSVALLPTGFFRPLFPFDIGIEDKWRQFTTKKLLKIQFIHR